VQVGYGSFQLLSRHACSLAQGGPGVSTCAPTLSVSARPNWLPTLIPSLDLEELELGPLSILQPFMLTAIGVGLFLGSSVTVRLALA
jgi:hypothetical protein